MADKTPSWVIKDGKAPPPAPEPDLMDTLGEYAQVGTRALVPYATAASLGAAAGAPFGGVGAAPGAAGGVLSLGLGDLLTGGYNLVAPVLGGERRPLPSETIQNVFQRIGVGKAPTTAGQQVFSDVLQAGAGGLGQAKSAQTLSRASASPTVQNWMKFLGSNARGQTGASIVGAAAPSIAANYFDITNPYALTGLSLAGSVAGGRAATPKVNIPTTENLKMRAQAAYKAAENAGVRVAQPELARLGTDVRTRLGNVQYDPGTQPQVRKWLNILDKNFTGPVSFQKLDALHSDLMAEARTVRNDRTRMMMQEIGGALDDFITNLKPSQVTAGQAGAATTALSQARQLWRSKSQLSLLDDAAEAAANRSQQTNTSFSDNIRNEYKKIVNNKRAFSRLSPDAQRAVKAVANGTVPSRFFEGIGKLSPTNRSAALAELMLGGGLFYQLQHPGTLLVPATLAAAGGGSKLIANRMVPGQVQRARAAITGTPLPRGYSLLPPAAQQALLARQRGETATRRRDVTETPFWAIPAGK